jgi:hypothetical protein
MLLLEACGCDWESNVQQTAALLPRTSRILEFRPAKVPQDFFDIGTMAKTAPIKKKGGKSMFPIVNV